MVKETVLLGPKSVLLSKTLWFNVLAGLVIVANAFGYVDFIPNEQVAEYATLVIMLINVVLRLVTKRGVVFALRVK